MNSEISDEAEEDEIEDESVANYDVRSKTVKTRSRVPKPLK